MNFSTLSGHYFARAIENSLLGLSCYQGFTLLLREDGAVAKNQISTRGLAPAALDGGFDRVYHDSDRGEDLAGRRGRSCAGLEAAKSRLPEWAKFETSPAISSRTIGCCYTRARGLPA
jgi:hypothetical protein